MALKVRYARSGDVHIAYAVLGDGPVDIVFVPGFVSNVSHFGDPERDPVHSAWFDHMSRFARVIVFDKRGTGLSDRTVDVASLDVRMDDVRVVMDAAGSERAALVGASEGGPMSILFTATFPERTHSLTLFGSMASFVRTDDHPWMPTLEERATTRALIEKYWGTGRIAAAFFPLDQVRDANKEDFAVGEIACASPGAAARLLEMDENIDVRSVLPTFSVPTLVVHATGDTIVPFQCAEYLARHIPNARLLTLDYAAHFGREPNGPIVKLGRRPGGIHHRSAARLLHRTGALDGVVHRHRGFHPAGGVSRRRAVEADPRPPRPRRRPGDRPT